MDNDKPTPLRASELQTLRAVTTLGLIATRMLDEHKVVTLMINKEGVVEVVPTGEIELDALPESSALSALIQKGYTDKQLEQYLAQREARYINNLAVGAERNKDGDNL